MVTPAIETVIKMLETLPEETQSQVVERLREWLADFEDEAAWDESFAKTQKTLHEAARQAREAFDAAPKPDCITFTSQWILTSYEIVHAAVILGEIQTTGQVHPRASA